MRPHLFLAAFALLMCACAPTSRLLIGDVLYIDQRRASDESRLGRYPGGSAVAHGVVHPEDWSRAQAGRTILASIGQPVRLVRINAYDSRAFPSFREAAHFAHAVLTNPAQHMSTFVYWSQPLWNIIVADLQIETGKWLPFECAGAGAFFRDQSGTAWWMLPSPFPDNVRIPPPWLSESVSRLRSRLLRPTTHSEPPNSTLQPTPTAAQLLQAR